MLSSGGQPNEVTDVIRTIERSTVGAPGEVAKFGVRQSGGDPLGGIGIPVR